MWNAVAIEGSTKTHVLDEQGRPLCGITHGTLFKGTEKSPNDVAAMDQCKRCWGKWERILDRTVGSQ